MTVRLLGIVVDSFVRSMEFSLSVGRIYVVTEEMIGWVGASGAMTESSFEVRV